MATSKTRRHFDWTEPDDKVFAFITDLLRPAGTYLYGRRLYESMAVWETDPTLAAQSELMGDFAHVWQAADKVVYSTTLQDVSTRKTRLERDFDADVIRGLKTSAAEDLTVGGANFAAHTFRAGLVDECQLLIDPVFVGAGKPALPRGRAPSSSSSTSAGSAMASCTSATASRPTILRRRGQLLAARRGRVSASERPIWRGTAGFRVVFPMRRWSWA